MALRDDVRLRRAVRRSERASLPATLRVLRRELGAAKTLAVLSEVALGKLRGEPFRDLGKPMDRRDVLSRRQVGPAVLLHRSLSKRIASERALEILREVTVVAGVIFLSDLLSDLDPAALAAEDPQKALVELEARASRMFNAEGEMSLSAEPLEVSFRVSRCRFVQLLDEIGDREILPLFCEVDRAFFQPEQTPIQLRRSKTLAKGDGECDFHFHW